MARETRLDAPGSLHHVMTRGIRGEPIFRDDWDRRDFLERLGRIAADERLRVLCWALMPNHVHLLTRSGPGPLPRCMQRLLTGYARAYNKRYGRVGYLFQGRYKSIRVEDDAYLRVVVRYVHRNPVEAGLVAGVAALDAYPWSGHAALLGRAPDLFGTADEVLGLFGATPDRARGQLRRWMKADRQDPSGAGVPKSVAEPPIHRDATLSGNAAAITEALGLLAAEKRAGQIALRARWRINDVVDFVCRRLGVAPDGVRGGGRSRRESRARAAIAFLAHARLGLPLSRIAREVGVSGAALGRSLGRGEEWVRGSGLDLGPAPDLEGHGAPRKRLEG